MSKFWCVLSFFSDGSGEPEVILVSDDEPALDAVIRAIVEACPAKRIAKVCPKAVLMLHHAARSPSTP